MFKNAKQQNLETRFAVKSMISRPGKRSVVCAGRLPLGNKIGTVATRRRSTTSYRCWLSRSSGTESLWQKHVAR